MRRYLKMKYILSFLLIAASFLFVQCSDNVDKKLQEYVKKANETSPRQLDQWTRFDSCSVAAGRTIRQYHTIAGIVVTDTAVFKSNMESSLFSMVKTSPNLSYFRKNDVTLIYQYNDEEGKYLFSMIVKPENYK